MPEPLPFHDFDWSQELSLIDIVNQPLPIHPKDREDFVHIYLLLRGKFKESNNFCTNCLTPTPSVPRSHHVECYNYKDMDVYPEPDLLLGYCPDCGSEFLSITSSYELEVSKITCQDCDFCYSDNLCEEDLIEKFLKEK